MATHEARIEFCLEAEGEPLFTIESLRHNFTEGEIFSNTLSGGAEKEYKVESVRLSLVQETATGGVRDLWAKPIMRIIVSEVP